MVTRSKKAQDCKASFTKLNSRLGKIECAIDKLSSMASGHCSSSRSSKKAISRPKLHNEDMAPISVEKRHTAAGQERTVTVPAMGGSPEINFKKIKESVSHMKQKREREAGLQGSREVGIEGDIGSGTAHVSDSNYERNAECPSHNGDHVGSDDAEVRDSTYEKSSNCSENNGVIHGDVKIETHHHYY